MPGYDMAKDDIVKRLNRIEGQVRGIKGMVDDGRYCIDVLDQVSAATRALQQVALGLVHEHLSHCVVEAVNAGDEEGRAKIEEATAAIARLVKA